MRANLSWVAIYADKRQIQQHPSPETETNIAALGEWHNFYLERNLPMCFFVGNNGIDLINGALCLEGKWYPPPPGCQPVKLIYYRIRRASLNGGAGQQCWHLFGYQDISGAVVKLQVPDDGSKPAYKFGTQELLNDTSNLITVG